MKNNVSVLFVCLGNICRSPAADGVMIELIEREEIDFSISVDSAGTSAFHAGEMADSRMRDAAKNRGTELLSISRQFISNDFEKFDYIIAMDNKNYRDILSLDINNEFSHKVFMMNEFQTEFTENEVPDPYYGGDSGFDHVLDIVTDGCQGLLLKIKSDL